MCQSLMFVGHENFPMFHIRHDESIILPLMLAFVKVSSSEFNSFLIIKVKFSHTRYRALGPGMIPVYRLSARR